MATDDPVREPFTAVANGPVVVVMGPMGVGVSMSASAALASAEALVQAAEEAFRNEDAGVPPS